MYEKPCLVVVVSGSSKVDPPASGSVVLVSGSGKVGPPASRHICRHLAFSSGGISFLFQHSDSAFFPHFPTQKSTICMSKEEQVKRHFISAGYLHRMGASENQEVDKLTRLRPEASRRNLLLLTFFSKSEGVLEKYLIELCSG